MKYRFFLIQAFHLPESSPYLHRPVKGAKEARLMNYDRVAPLLSDVEWELHPGVPNIQDEKAKALRGERSAMLEAARERQRPTT